MSMKRIDLYINEVNLSFLSTLSGTVSEHIRRAIDEYIEKVKNFKVSSSLSKEGGEKNG